MVVRTEMCIDEVLDEIGSEVADVFVELFGSEAEYVLENWLEDEEIDCCAARIEANKVEILGDIVESLGRKLTREELKKLWEEADITERDCEDEGIEHEGPLVDEEGREYELVDEDERQMTLWPEDGPRMKLRRYVA